MAYIGIIILNFHKNLPIGSLGGTNRYTGMIIPYAYRLQRFTTSGNNRHTYRTLCEVQQVQCCIECFITGTHEEQNRSWCVIDAHYGIFWQVNELVTCLTLQQAPGNIEQTIITLVAHTFHVSVRIFLIIAGIYW
jgi:hypothetical protein